jgi:hypothetical protein
MTLYGGSKEKTDGTYAQIKDQNDSPVVQRPFHQTVEKVPK